MPGVKIISTGYYVPEKILTNADLEKMVDTSDEWITTRTGIKERRIASASEAVSDLAAASSKSAIEKAGISPDEIDLIINATFTADYPLPSSAVVLGRKLGIKNVQMFDLSAACTGFIYGLAVGYSMIKTGIARTALITGVEKLSSVTDWEDRASCVIFADGAGSCIIQASEEENFLSFSLGADGAFRELLYIPAGGSLNPASHKTVDEKGHFVKMEGNKTFKIAVSRMKATAKDALEKANVAPGDIKLLIPHQANMRIIDALARALNFPMEKVFVNIDKLGNSSAATVPIGLAQAAEQGRVKRGDLVELVAFGGGFTWGATVFRY